MTPVLFTVYYEEIMWLQSSSGMTNILKQENVEVLTMIIDLSNALLNTGTHKQYTVSLEMNSFSYPFGTYEITHKPEFTLTAVSPRRDNIHIEGRIILTLLIPCDRCLESVVTELDFQIDKDICLDADTQTEDMDDQSFVDGHTIDIDKMLYNEILLNVPMKTLCGAACKGICKRCGMNLNNGSCDCDNFVPDPRMSVISDIFKNFGNN